jgi:hypothetical protein
MLRAYDPQYFFVNDTNIISSVLQFATDKEAKLVIALPHKYSFFTIAHSYQRFPTTHRELGSSDFDFEVGGKVISIRQKDLGKV